MLRPKFDSTFFVAFKLTHEALDAALKKASELNITQYRVLVKLLTAGTAGLPQKDVSALLDLKPNVVTQAINTLEERGLALRANGATDKRFRRARCHLRRRRACGTRECGNRRGALRPVPDR